MTGRVLVIDDEVTLGRNIKAYLTRHGYQVSHAASGREARELLAAQQYDVVLLDMRLPDTDGLELLPEIRERSPAAAILVMTAHATIPTAVEAMRGGAFDYLTKPVALSELKERLDRLHKGAARTDPRRPGIEAGLAAILGNSPLIIELRQRIARLLEAEALSGALSPAVLVIGETGTGKELVAQALHRGSARAGGPFVELNCTTLPAHLVEDELFGHERGAFTDARERKLGLIEAASGGTLFLDEIGDLESAVQAKILKVLEDRKVRRLGSVQEQAVDVRIVAATNRPLELMVAQGTFRADLYFRLRVVELCVPPLRARDGDVLLLARHFLDESATRWRRSRLSLTPEAEAALQQHHWSGNVRELRNVVEQAVLLSQAEVICPSDLALSSLAAPGGIAVSPAAAAGEGLSMEAAERSLLLQALERSDGNVTAAAKLLAVSRDTVRYRMQKHGLSRNRDITHSGG